VAGEQPAHTELSNKPDIRTQNFFRFFVPLSPIPAHSVTHIPDSSRAQQTFGSRVIYERYRRARHDSH
jgi:hypothetical protein